MSSETVANSKGKECYVKDEYILPKKEQPPLNKEETENKHNEDNTNTESTETNNQNSNKGQKKRGTNKKRPIFKIANKVSKFF